MDEHVVMDRNKSVNVVTYQEDGEIYIAVENGDDRTTVIVNPTQARKLANMLAMAASICEQN